MKTLNGEWRRYRQLVLPRDASEVQVEETRLAFYNGATSMFALMCDVSEGDDVTPADIARIQQLNRELEAHKDQMIERAAASKQRAN